MQYQIFGSDYSIRAIVTIIEIHLLKKAYILNLIKKRSNFSSNNTLNIIYSAEKSLIVDSYTILPPT